MLCRKIRYSVVTIFILFASPMLLASQEVGIAWRYATGGAIRGEPMISADGKMVYFISEDRYLYAVTSGGIHRWRYYLGDRVADSLSVGVDGTLYAGLKKGGIVAVNPAGKEIWRFLYGDGDPPGPPVTGTDGSIYFATKGGEIYKLSHTGRIKWKIETSSEVSAPVTLGKDNRLYIPLFDGKLLTLTPWGEVLWSIKLNGSLGRPVVDPDGYIFILSSKGIIYAIGSNGELLWNYETGMDFSEKTYPVLKDNKLYLCSKTGKIFVIDKSGRLLWKQSIPESVETPCILGVRGGLFVFSPRGNLYRVSYDEEPVLVFSMYFSPVFPVIACNGYLFTGGADWIFYALDLGNEEDNCKGNKITITSGWNIFNTDNFFEAEMEYKYLKLLVESDSIDSKKRAIRELEERINKGYPGKAEPYILNLLTLLLRQGVFSPIESRNRWEKNYPEIRLKAALLMGEIGNLYTQSLLVDFLRYEYDSRVLAAVIEAIGNLRSDPEGLARKRFLELLETKGRRIIDNSIAKEIIVAIDKIIEYHGELGDEAARALLYIFREDYNRDVRQKALSVLRGF
ncbi:MAG: hypothetical protein DRP87_06905 [Spirochaetes bacterium]|nr:MAG: hypothetical protein DRP87_06905 [Spirochaetota bacterium]